MNVKLPPTRRGDPTWAVALSYPRQGDWTEEEFLELDHDNQPRELCEGYLEVLPMPTGLHQRISRFLLYAIETYLRANNLGGELLYSPLPTHILPGIIREPDIIYLNAAQSAAMEKYPDEVDVVMEIVSDSPSDRKRDYITKRREYARAGILEYWIVDPQEELITVLTPDRAAKKYKVHGKFTTGASATSVYFKGLKVAVNEVFRKR